ncbi:hypothetical protein C0Q44_23380 [Paenibacillus sp. PCH8]|nr:hypothetical protein C0Q44_23380 [Paenibacillus sp. PCH8]
MPILCCLLLSGCWDRIEINDLAIVLATGIDYEDGKVQLTSQIFIPRKASAGDSSGSGGSPSGVTMIRTAEGRTIAEALNRLQRKVPRNMFWGTVKSLSLVNKLVNVVFGSTSISFFATLSSGNMHMSFPAKRRRKTSLPYLILWSEVLQSRCEKWPI